jgi:ABC-2 type transport system ATP-binding protein
MGDVKELCKRVIIIDKGKLVFDGQLEEITKKYADQKILDIVLAKEVDPRKIEEISKVSEFEYPRVKLKVKRSKVSQVTSEALNKLPIADLNVEEPAIEDIIRELFTGKNYA